MDDKTLLKLAAKAAEIKIDRWVTEGGQWWDGTDFELPGRWHTWNPLTDDGDALRLAVKLELGIEIAGMAACVTKDGIKACIESGPDPYAATRRAIVRAAAEIVKGMK